MEHGVRTPWPPTLRMREQLRDGGPAAVAVEPALDGDVGEECVAFAEGAHGDVLGCPFADAGEFAKAGDGFGEIAAGVE